MTSLPPRLVLFDGECAVCDATVQFLLDRDPSGALHFAPLQGETAQQIQRRHPEWPPDLDSLVLVEQGPDGEHLYWRSTGVLRMLAALPAPWRWLAVLQWCPRPARDLAYRAFARVRIRLFGRVTSCRLPTPEQAQQLWP